MPEQPVVNDFSLLAAFGWKPLHLQSLTLAELDTRVIGRITRVERDRYVVQTDKGSCNGRLSTRSLPSEAEGSQRPTVGDWVLLEDRFDDGDAIIDRRLPRINVLERTAAGQEMRASVSRQVLCANVDTALIVASLDGTLNHRRLERFVTLARAGGVQAVVVLSKADECAAPADACRLCAERLDLPDVIAVDARSDAAREALSPWLVAGDTLVLLGSSGVGKSTLANTLAGTEQQRTGGVRTGDSKGRHTTSNRSLIQLPSQACLIDTPGLRELALAVDEQALDQSFGDILVLAEQCRFSDCGHGNEPGCAVRSAIETGDLSGERLDGYLQLLGEAQARQRLAASVHERRRREKSFGKVVKNAMRDKGKRRGDG